MTAPAVTEPAAATEPAATTEPAAAEDVVAAGSVVHYEHPDPITGETLRGAGVVLWVPESGAITVAPLAMAYLYVEPDNVVAIPAAAWLDDEA